MISSSFSIRAISLFPPFQKSKQVRKASSDLFYSSTGREKYLTKNYFSQERNRKTIPYIPHLFQKFACTSRKGRRLNGDAPHSIFYVRRGRCQAASSYQKKPVKPLTFICCFGFPRPLPAPPSLPPILPALFYPILLYFTLKGSVLLHLSNHKNNRTDRLPFVDGMYACSLFMPGGGSPFQGLSSIFENTPLKQ